MVNYMKAKLKDNDDYDMPVSTEYSIPLYILYIVQGVTDHPGH